MYTRCIYIMTWLIILYIIFVCYMLELKSYQTESKIKCSRYTDLGNSTSDPIFCKRMQIVFERTCGQTTFDFRIIVIVFDRHKSLLRILRSLNEAVYDGDKIKLEVWIDRSKTGHMDEDTVKTANTFSFKHGVYEVIQHSEHVGIAGQWISTWRPEKTSTENAVILEDDITVSKYFYRYLKNVHKKYDHYLDINGFALQGYSIKHHIKNKSRLVGPKGSYVFLYPLFGTWGFSPSRNNWIHFQKWFISACRNETIDFDIPNNVVSKWYKAAKRYRKQHTIWEMWHIYHAYINSEVSLFANLPGGEGMSTNWQEKGLHYTKTLGPTNKLLEHWMLELDFENLPSTPKRVNLLGQIQN